MRRNAWSFVAAALLLAAPSAEAQPATSNGARAVEFVIKEVVTYHRSTPLAVVHKPSSDGVAVAEVRRSALTPELVAHILRTSRREFVRGVDFIFVAEHFVLRPLNAGERMEIAPTMSAIGGQSTSSARGTRISLAPR